VLKAAPACFRALRAALECTTLGRAVLARTAHSRAALATAVAALAVAVPAHADQQRDPELKTVVEHAISQAECFTDHYDSAVWYKLMEPRLRPLVRDQAERLEILKDVYCETHRAGEARLPPGLVMGVMAIESRFDRWAVSASGAVGLMQVMPFWPEQLGMQRRELVSMEPNIRMGCAILRHYLQTEHNDVRRALGRYNGSTRSREYPDRVVTRWTRYWNGADDLGRG
jgi:soluble lytic murein transglycosylase-like protein